MASMILYKFRSGTTFEALPLPGSAARLFDVKKAIIHAKKLDAQSAMDFDLAVRNADTNEEYSNANESTLLPRGTRLVVQRMPAPRGQGFLARMARGETSGTLLQQTQASAPSGFYTLENRTGPEDEFVPAGAQSAMDDDNELAALQAVTSLRPTDGPVMTGGSAFGARGGRGGFKPNHNTAYRPNADPELREQEKKLLPKKRATGIPRTFLNLAAPPQTEGGKEGEEGSSLPLLQPNTLGFKELLARGGGLSENTAGTRRSLDYALKLTATEIPEFLQCAICHSVVKDAMLLPWDSEGRTTCETCIRDSLAQTGFRCPLTGIEGVSPDDLHPNYALRKAADQFIESVMEKIDEIEKEQVEETAPPEDDETENPSTTTMENILDGDGAERGVIISKRAAAARKKEEEDVFGAGEDPFGGDVFAVETEKPEEEAAEAEKNASAESKDETGKSACDGKSSDTKPDVKSEKAEGAAATAAFPQPTPKPHPQPQPQPQPANDPNKKSDSPEKRLRKNSHDGASLDGDNNQRKVEATNNRRERRRRGLPAGYTMGPAGGAAISAIAPPSPAPSNDRRGSRDDGAIGRWAGGSGGHGRYDRDRGYTNSAIGGSSYQSHSDNQDPRGTKRSRIESQQPHHSGGAPPPPPTPPPQQQPQDGYYDNRRGGGGFRGGWRGGYRGGRGVGRGGYGRGGGGGYGRGRY